MLSFLSPTSINIPSFWGSSAHLHNTQSLLYLFNIRIWEISHAPARALLLYKHLSVLNETELRGEYRQGRGIEVYDFVVRRLYNTRTDYKGVSNARYDYSVSRYLYSR